MSQAMNNRATMGKIEGLPTAEVIRRGMSETLDTPQDADTYVQNVARLAQSGMIKPIQIGNTVFLMHHYNIQNQPLPQGVAEVHVFTTESLPNLLMRMRVFPNTARQLGYTKITSFVDDPAIARIWSRLQRETGIQGTIKPTVEYINGEMTPVYRMEATL